MIGNNNFVLDFKSKSIAIGQLSYLLIQMFLQNVRLHENQNGI